MAIVKSDVITDALDLDTQIQKGHGKPIRGVTGVASPTGALADNSTLFFFEIPVDAILDSVILHSDDLGTTGDMNIGVYKGLRELEAIGVTVDSLTDADAVDEDCIATAVDLNAAAVANTEVRFEVKDINTANKKMWELAGLSSRPTYETFLVGGTLSEATTAAGDVVLHAKFRV